MSGKKSIMASLGLKKTPIVRRVPYELPDVFEDPSDWHQIVKILFKENAEEELITDGQILLDEAFWRSTNKTVIRIQSLLEKDVKPFCGRKAYLGQLFLEKGLLHTRSDDQFNEGMENIMLFIITFKNKKFLPNDLVDFINLEITADGKDKTAWKDDTYIAEKINEYIEDPERFYPTLPVFAKAIAPLIFNIMQGAVNEIMDTVVDDQGKNIYNKDLPKFRIANDDLVVILVGGTIYGANAKSMWLDDVCYILPEEEE